MPRCRKLCIAVFALIVLIILCTLTHLDKFKPDSSPKELSSSTHASVVLPAVEPIYTELLIIKSLDGVFLDGVFSAQDESDQLVGKIESLGTLLADRSRVDDNRQSAEWVVSVTQILEPFMSSFDSGRISYKNRTLDVQGSISSQVELDRLLSMLSNTNITYTHNIELIVPEVEETQGNIEVAQKELADLLSIENIEFKKASDYLSRKGSLTVKKLADILKRHSTIKVEIAGHTDSDGDDNLNLRLSQARVDSVKDELILLGISPDRLRAVGYGESRPLVSNTDAANKQKNRRVEFIVIGE